jgi:hypothetical protein
MKLRFLNLDPAVGRIRVGGVVRVGQGTTRRRLNACNEEQRRPARATPLNRVRSAVTRLVNAFVSPKLKAHQVSLAYGKRSTAGSRLKRVGVTASLLGSLMACGGGGNPLGNPADVSNPQLAPGAQQKLSFAYFQKCINPILLAQLQINLNGTLSTNTCASSGCHDNTTGTGGALRVVGNAQSLDLSDAANTPEVIRATDMYKNFYSAQGSVVLGSPAQSRLLTKPLVLNVLHGGGLIFENDQDPNARLIQYWITRPAPSGQDEFSSATDAMFTPPNPSTGACNTL